MICLSESPISFTERSVARRAAILRPQLRASTACTPAKAYVADCWVCDAFGRIDPGLNTSLVPVRKEDFAHPHHQHPPKGPVDVTVTL